jgi:hypothetical protein
LLRNRYRITPCVRCFTTAAPSAWGRKAKAKARAYEGFNKRLLKMRCRTCSNACSTARNSTSLGRKRRGSRESWDNLGAKQSRGCAFTPHVIWNTWIILRSLSLKAWSVLTRAGVTNSQVGVSKEASSSISTNASPLIEHKIIPEGLGSSSGGIPPYKYAT